MLYRQRQTIQSIETIKTVVEYDLAEFAKKKIFLITFWILFDWRKKKYMIEWGVTILTIKLYYSI